MERTQFSIFSGVCSLCGDVCGPAMDLCAPCRADLPFQTHACRACGVTLPVSGLCGRCLVKPPFYQGVVSLFDYAPPVDGLITGLKYHGKLGHARLLGLLLAQRLLQQGDEPPEVVLPVPLHRRRLRERGFNQAVEIARPVAHALRIPIELHGCRRERMTSPQSTLPAARRRKNVSNAFAIARDFRWRRVAIVDDVMTTGHTVAALAHCLGRHGVEEVRVWVCARAAPPAGPVVGM